MRLQCLRRNEELVDWYIALVGIERPGSGSEEEFGVVIVSSGILKMYTYAAYL
jgi:hypothetical protein